MRESETVVALDTVNTPSGMLYLHETFASVRNFLNSSFTFCIRVRSLTTTKNFVRYIWK